MTGQAGHGPDPADPVTRVRRQAWLASTSWWLLLAGAYVLFTKSRPGPPPGCDGVGCLNEQGILLLLGLFVGLPVMIIGMVLSAVVVGFRARHASSGPALGTRVALATMIGIALVVALLLQTS
jgi:hypothetical protein